MATITLTPTLSDEYQNLFDTCHVRPEHDDELGVTVARVKQNRSRYEAVGNPLRIPWYVVGVIHCLEASFSFSSHLHNGDPLAARTVHEPPNRPPGEPPFSWEASAIDALQMRGLDQVTSWNLPPTLYELEGYNGFGYRLRHPEVLTPYLWSFSDHYTQGKYIADGTFSPTAVSKQCGAAVLLRRMAELGVIEFRPDGTPLTNGVDGMTFDRLGPLIRFSSTTKSSLVEDLQKLLNTVPGIFVKVDGVPGKKTSDAFKKVTGHFLAGDPRA
jgi:lysozyme family protein